MNKIFLALLASAILVTPASAGDKPKRNKGYNVGGYSEGWKPNRRVYNRRNVYNYNYTYKYKNNDNGWYAFGGFLGGLALGGALAAPGPGYGGGAYYYDQPGAQCTTIFKRVWNDVYQEWENIPRTICGGY